MLLHFYLKKKKHVDKVDRGFFGEELQLWDEIDGGSLTIFVHQYHEVITSFLAYKLEIGEEMKLNLSQKLAEMKLILSKE